MIVNEQISNVITIANLLILNPTNLLIQTYLPWRNFNHDQAQ